MVFFVPNKLIYFSQSIKKNHFFDDYENTVFEKEIEAITISYITQKILVYDVESCYKTYLKFVRLRSFF